MWKLSAAIGSCGCLSCLNLINTQDLFVVCGIGNTFILHKVSIQEGTVPKFQERDLNPCSQDVLGPEVRRQEWNMRASDVSQES